MFALALAAALEQQGARIQSVTLIDTYAVRDASDALERVTLSDLLFMLRSALEEDYPEWRPLWEAALETSTVPGLLRSLPPHEAIDTLCDWLARQQMATSGLREVLRQQLHLSLTHTTLLHAYHPPRLSAPLQLYQANEPLLGHALGATRLDGRDYTTGSVVTHVVEGTHFRLLRPPYVRALAAHWQRSTATHGV